MIHTVLIGLLIGNVICSSQVLHDTVTGTPGLGRGKSADHLITGHSMDENSQLRRMFTKCYGSKGVFCFYHPEFRRPESGGECGSEGAQLRAVCVLVPERLFLAHIQTLLILYSLSMLDL